jgi:hypothetical protein
MPVLPRLVVPEVLDELAADDPRAQRSRRDLRIVHTVMRSPSILRRLIARLSLEASPCRIIELGAGDGSLMLRVAASLGARLPRVELTLLDRVDLLTDATRAAYRRLGWEATGVRADVLDWAGAAASDPYDLCIVALFLHHFRAAQLEAILQGIARRANALVCIEPRRSALARVAAGCVGVIGAGAVTRGDAVKSVVAGFRDGELTQAWNGSAGNGTARIGTEWILEEFAALPFTHCFTGRRVAQPRATQPRATESHVPPR